MNDANKNKILDLIEAGGAINKIAAYKSVGSGLYGIDSTLNETISWGAAAGGVLTNSAAVSLVNDSGSSITVEGVALFSSTVSITAHTDAVAYYPFATQVVLDDGEILRLNTVTYTID